MIARPPEAGPHLCADRGYHNTPAREAMETMNYAPHVRQRGKEAEAKKAIAGYKPRRWIVKVAHSCFN